MADPEWIGNIDLPTAVSEEANWKADLLPEPLINEFAVDNQEMVVDYLADFIRDRIDSDRAEIVAASKWAYGRRPVALLPLVERVLYRAVVNSLGYDVPAPSRGSDHYVNFTRAVLDEPNTNMVVITDLSNFYSTIPTDLLCDELRQRTGRWHEVEWLRRFWRTTAGGLNGVPQGAVPSDRVADAYADELHRRLLRRGIRSWRYSDDFRLAAQDQSHAISMLETFDDEARKLGLYVNERKTFTPGIERYREMLEQPNNLLGQISAEVRERMTAVDIYTLEATPPEDLDVLKGVAAQVLQQWQSASIPAGGTVTTEIENARLVRMALSILEATHNLAGIEYCSEIVRREPQLTPAVCQYLADVSQQDVVAAYSVVDTVVSSVPLTKWQSMWLLWFLASNSAVPAEPAVHIVSWMEERASSNSEGLRSSAIWALARNFLLSDEAWMSASLSATRLGSPFISGAFEATSASHATERSTMLSSDKLDREVNRWVTETGRMQRPF